MIQRIQTLWLFLAGLSAFLTLKFPTYVGYLDSTKPYDELNGMNGGLLLLTLTVLAGLLAWVGIGLFRNRKMQSYICIAGILAQAVLFYMYYLKTASYKDGAFSLTAVLHLLVILFFLLAFSGIRKDEKLVRESDRLR